ncbi:MAG: hypothetical protein LBH90_08825 [Tannerella sp.]|jgi:C-terminal processing protease CtpA/Prc|nr:hypothetical protein [Tannerella sp.]
MKKQLKWFVLWSSYLLLFFTACSDDKKNELIIVPENPIPKETLLVNDFIATNVRDAYLWTSTINWAGIEPDKEPDSFDFFEKLRYDQEDKWSMLTNDQAALSDGFAGVSTTYGYQLIFGKYSNVDAFFAIVLYVYPGSPAEKAGLKRGNFITSKGFEYITKDNYMDLYNTSSLLLSTGIYKDGEIVPDSSMKYIMAEKMYEDPIHACTVITKGAHKIGYLCYTDFTMESESRLQDIFTEFKLNKVTDVVLDLRYNGGGFARTSCLLSSILAPLSAVKGKEIFISEHWNDAYMDYFKKRGADTNEYFTDTLAVNMNLSRIYVLTSRSTASASESTMVGLTPYLELIQIGDTTHGKYCGGVVFSPEVWDKEKESWIPVEEIDHWGMYLMIYRFANKNGATSFTGGLVPDIQVEEDYFNLYPFGDERDPLLAHAISRITGEPLAEVRAEVPASSCEILKSIRPVKALDGKMINTRPLPRLN